jgi:hypothetical protein
VENTFDPARWLLPFSSFSDFQHNLGCRFSQIFYCFNARNLIPGNVFALIDHVTHVPMVESAI